MALRTKGKYLESLRDDRVVYYKGEKVRDVTSHPVLSVAVNHAAIDYEMAENPKYQDLALVKVPGTEEVISRYYRIPRNAEDLQKRSELIEATTKEAGTLVTLIKEIGTDALFSLHLVGKMMQEKLKSPYFERVSQFYEHCKKNDLAVAVAQTDVKGDRSLGPSEQEHPDYYVRVVDENKDGIVVRGAKVHTSVSVNSNEIIVLPTRAMKEGDKDYAVAFAVPANTKGLKMIASCYGAPKKSSFDNPVSSKHKMEETLTIFEDVFVPWERVFLKGEWDFAGALALAFVEFHRFTAVSYKLPLLDAFVGCAHLAADYNGVLKVSHVRDKITGLITYAETVRGLIRQAALQCRVRPPDMAVPDSVLTNIAKFHFATHYHQALAYVQDIAGGLLVTAPSEDDLKNPETGKDLEKYFGGKKGVPPRDRLRLINLISDLTVSDFGGYQAVLAVHAEGSIEAEKLAIYRGYDMRRATDYAKELAGIAS